MQVCVLKSYRKHIEGFSRNFYISTEYISFSHQLHVGFESSVAKSLIVCFVASSGISRKVA